ncbi:MAG: transporter substrate-binding domain-containing protein [Clostridia bacterium]|nr:transporter substrate-binding domain-containing protein [Clostridia bacterium]
MKRWFVIWMTMLLLLGASALAEITSVEQLDRSGVKVGTELGCAAELTIRQELPEATLEQYNDKNLGYVDVANGRLDAFIFERMQMQKAINAGVNGVRLLDENMGDVVKVAVGVSPVSGIPDLKGKINQFIAELRADGTLDEMFERWAIDGNEEMPKIDLPGRPELHLIVGTSGIVPPYSYYVGTTLNGYDIELAYRLAAWLNADLEFKVYDYGAIVPAALSGDVDCIIANLNVTPERAEALPFSDTLYEMGLGVMVRGETPPQSPAATYGRVGVQTGSSFDAIISEKMPDAEAIYFNTKADLVAALNGNKIDTFVVDEPVAKILMREDDRLTFLPDYLETFSFALLFPKSEAGEALRDRFNGFIETLRADGTLDALEEKWFAEDEDAKTMPDVSALSAENGTLRVATEAGYAPFEYVRDGKVVGYDMELAARFCEAFGYGLEIVDMNFDGILSSVQAGKCDFAAAAITVTPERAQTVLFSEPYFSGGTVLIVLKQSDEKTPAPGDYNGKRGGVITGSFHDSVIQEALPDSSISEYKSYTDMVAALTDVQTGQSGFMESLSDSFNKTFLREDRWRLFLTGVQNTLIITMLSILFGTALGFAVYMLCRNGNPVANGITRFCTWLVQGMPMVVLLMILYYVIFGSVSIGGIVVAIIGFAFTFGSAVYGMLRMGVGAVDGGQYEAAYALGYSNRRTFYRIILPQAAPHILPAYKGEVVGLIKATSIVGYIAVQDLTKMGDIVRSRTYEAFFPLIAVTIIYFVLEGLIGFLVSRIGVCFSPKRRKPDEILKGIRTDAQD